MKRDKFERKVLRKLQEVMDLVNEFFDTYYKWCPYARAVYVIQKDRFEFESISQDYTKNLIIKDEYIETLRHELNGYEFLDLIIKLLNENYMIIKQIFPEYQYEKEVLNFYHEKVEDFKEFFITIINVKLLATGYEIMCRVNEKAGRNLYVDVLNNEGRIELKDRIGFLVDITEDVENWEVTPCYMYDSISNRLIKEYYRKFK